MKRLLLSLVSVLRNRKRGYSITNLRGGTRAMRVMLLGA